MKNSELKKYISDGKLDSRLVELYADPELLDFARERLCKAIDSFTENFGEKEISIFSAPGRSEVCGNHTDHQHGSCLAASINLDVIVVASKSDTALVRVLSEGYSLFSVDSEDLKYSQAESGSTLSLIKGILKGFKEEGFSTGGFDCYITSNVIQGAGLSSSAAFENAIGTVLNHYYNDGKVNFIDIAKISRFAENVYFGKPCGLLDQLTSSSGGLVYMDFKNVENPEVEKINVDFAGFGYSLCIVDTKGSHADLTDDYAAIPKEMKTVAEFFGETHLRNVNPDEFSQNIHLLREKCTDRAILRALHFFNEQENVSNIVKTLKEGNFQGFLHCVKTSGNYSNKFLQNIYSSRTPESQNINLALAVTEQILMCNKGAKSRYGVCRVHGGGFAGTIQAFVKNDFVREYKKQIEKIFGEDSCHVLKVRAEGSVKVI